jgi:hypothetical protein
MPVDVLSVWISAPGVPPPAIVSVPCTCKVVVGAVVPIPTLPPLVTEMALLFG